MKSEISGSNHTSGMSFAQIGDALTSCNSVWLSRSTYKSYVAAMSKETTGGRRFGEFKSSHSTPASALSFSHVQVGDALTSCNSVWLSRSTYKSYVAAMSKETTGGRRVGEFKSSDSTPASALSFSHVQVGDAFLIINHISQRRDKI